MKMRQAIAIAVSVLLAAGWAAAAPAATVTLVDGQTVQGKSVTLAEGKFQLLDEQGQAAGQWEIDGVAAVAFEKPSEIPDPGDKVGWVQFVGGRVRGTVESFDGDVFTVTSPELGPLKLPVACVEAVSFTKAMPEEFPAAGQAASDMLVLANHDRVSGTLNSMDDKTVAFHSNDLGDLKLERARVLALRVTPVGKRPEKTLPVLKFTLAAGGSIELSGVAMADGKAAGSFFGGPKVTFPLERVAAIEVVGGRLAYLETLEPKEYQQQSLDLLKWDIKRGLNVLGQPMQIRRQAGQAAETMSHGLGVHAPCRVVYALDGKFERFLSLAAVDESSGRWADVNLVVKVDGKEVFRADHVKWQEAARTVNVPTVGAALLELIVETGEHFDVQDRVDWAEARLLRAKGK